MSISDEIQRLDDLRRGGALSTEEFELAKQQVIHRDGNPESPESSELFQAQLALARLDRAWRRQRESFKVRNKYGAKCLPHRGLSLFAGLLVGGLGIYLAGMTMPLLAIAPSGWAVLLVVNSALVIASGVITSSLLYAKAEDYDRAKLRYKRRRRKLLAQIEAL